MERNDIEKFAGGFCVVGETTTQNRPIDKEKLFEQVGWLKQLVAGLKTLKPEEFDYNDYVKSFDKKTLCGTVCCAFGWMPRFVPEANVKYGLRTKLHGNLFFNISPNNQTLTVSTNPDSTFTEIPLNENNFMFYGKPTFGIKNNVSKTKRDIYIEKYGDGYSANLNQVINRIELVIEKYESSNESYRNSNRKIFL